jgi:hypothetical protein
MTAARCGGIAPTAEAAMTSAPILALAAGVLLAAGAQAQTPARDSVTGITHPTDVSSASKKKRHVTTPSPVYGAPPGSAWRGPDPSRGPGTAQLRQYQREGRCVIDEGYGRYTFCDTY